MEIAKPPIIQKKSKPFKVVAIVAGVLTLGVIARWADPVKTPRSVAQAEAAPPRPAPQVKQAPPPKWDKSAAMQADRGKLIDKLIAAQVFRKTVKDSPTFVTLVVAPMFYAADFDDKKKFASVVYAYYFDGTESLPVVLLIDSKTGKDVGKFTELGFKLY